jgi:DNA-binding response OmpR family regulator
MTLLAPTRTRTVTRIPTGVSTGRVLVLDTDEGRQALLSDLVARAGTDVVLAASGVEAMDRLRTRRPDGVLIADLEDGSARGFLAWLRPRYPDLAVIAVAPGIEEATELYLLGADIVETLPLDPDRLGAKLAAVMRRKTAIAHAMPADADLGPAIPAAA